MQFADKTLKCVACLEEFVFTAEEQQFFFEKQFVNIPRRCKKCQAKRKQTGKARGLQETRTTCSSCGLETTLPFKPTQGRPVLCRTCFQTQGKTQ
jgi:CxxC-x17-CxxC domain-containing protein